MMYSNFLVTIFRFTRSCHIDVRSVYLFSALCMICAGKVLAQEMACAVRIYPLDTVFFL